MSPVQLRLPKLIPEKYPKLKMMEQSKRTAFQQLREKRVQTTERSIANDSDSTMSIRNVRPLPIFTARKDMDIEKIVTKWETEESPTRDLSPELMRQTAPRKSFGQGKGQSSLIVRLPNV
jgi:hypothetical protein